MGTPIENYESLLTITSQMRQAATRGDWDTLIALESRCKQQISILQQADATMAISQSDSKRKAELIRQIMADDAEIRNHTQPWMTELQRLMQGARMEQRVAQHYSGLQP